MSEDTARRRENLRKKYKQAIEDIIKGAKQLAEGGGRSLNPFKKKNKDGKTSEEDILSAGAALEAEKKAEQLSAFLEEEVFKKIETLEGRIEELENNLATVTASVGTTGL